MQRLKNIIRKILRGFYYLITSPRLTFLLFQVRFIERYFKIDFFFISPRRLLIFYIESRYLKSSYNKFNIYGNYKLDKYKIPKRSIVYSGGVGRNIEFDLSFYKNHKSKIRLFDPTENSINFIKQTKLKKNIFFYPYALFYKNKKIKLYKDPTNRVKSASVTNFFSFSTKSFFFANGYNLPTLKAKFNDKKIDILKLDIEGAAENLILNAFKNKIYPTQIVSAFEVPLNYLEFYKFLKKIVKLIEVLKKKYDVYNIRDRSRGVEMEILAIKKVK